MPTPHDCLHEDMLQEQSTKIAELEAKNGFKEQRIMELIQDNRRIESKIDNLTDVVNKSILNSVQGDSDLKQRVTNLEVKIDTQNTTIEKYKNESNDNTHLKLAYAAVVISIIALILPHVLSLGA